MKKGRGLVLGYTLTIFCALALVHWGSKTVTTVSQQIALPRAQTIVIDAGHGGVDGGATSCTGKLESQYNLQIAKRLQDLLLLMGYQVKMIRVSDESVYTEGDTIAEKKVSDLKERVRIVNSSCPGILISIHQNLFPDSRYFGAQVFYAETPGSEALARVLQQALSEHLSPSTSRQEKKSKGIYLMDHIRCPGILLECGFLSNPEEESRLSDPCYQKQLCAVIAASLDHFLG